MNPSGTDFARSCFAAGERCSFRAATCGRSIATFPSCELRFLEGLPDGCVVDGEIVIATPHGLDFDALQLRLHPAASRVAKLSQETPAAFVAFDAIAVDRQDLRGMRAARAPSEARAYARARRAADPRDAGDARSCARIRVADPVRRSRARRRDGETGRRSLRAWQARDDQGEARTNGRLRRRRFSVAQSGERRARGLAAARAVRCAATAASCRRHVVVHAWPCAGNSRRSSRRCASARPKTTRGAGGPRPAAARRRGCPGDRAGGAREKICRGSRFASSASARSSTTTCRGSRFRHAAVFQRWRSDKRPGDCGYDQLEVTTPYELAKIFRPGPLDAAPVVEIVVRVERLLRGSERRRDVLKIDPHARPRPEPAAHDVHEDVRGVQMRARLRVACLPTFEAGQRVRFRSSASDFYQRVSRNTAA